MSGERIAAGRIPELDGLRGLAIGSVLIFHYFGMTIHAEQRTTLAYLLVPLRLSWSGVDLFFVLSGFLIGGILLDARGSQNYFQVFYRRRFFRIVPIYLVCFASTIVLAMLLAGFSGQFAFLHEWNAASIPWLARIFFLQNFWMAASSSPHAIDLTWSLAVEEQFYLTLPLLVWMVPRQKLVRWVVPVICLAPVIRCILLWAYPDKIWSRFVLMPCRADALMLGALGAILMRDEVWRARIANNRAVVRILLAVFAAGFIFLTLRSPSTVDRGIQTFGLTWLASFYLCILLYGLTNKSGWLNKLLRVRWLAWLGGIAYGVYLFHSTILQLTFGFFRHHEARIENIPDIFITVLALALTLAFCRMSWIYFEKPLVKIGHKQDYEFAKATMQPYGESPQASGERA